MMKFKTMLLSMRTTGALSLFVLLLLLIACSSPNPAKTKHFRNVSAPPRPLAHYLDTSLIIIATDSLPEDLWIVNTSLNDLDSIQAAMDRLLVRVKGTARYQPKQHPAQVLMAKSDILQFSEWTRKMVYVTELGKTGECVSIGINALTFEAEAFPTGDEHSRFLQVDLSDKEQRQLSARISKATIGSRSISKYWGTLTIRLSVMLEDGTFAREEIRIIAGVGIADGFQAGFHVVNDPSPFETINL
jgi:hypothetical protein